MSSFFLSFLSLVLIALSVYVFWYNDRVIDIRFDKCQLSPKPVVPAGCRKIFRTYYFNHLKGGVCPVVCLAVLERKSLYYVLDRWYSVNGRYRHGSYWMAFIKYLEHEGFSFSYHLLTGERAFRVRRGFVNVVGLVWPHRAHYIVVTKDWFFSNDEWLPNSYLSTFLLGARRCGWLEVSL